MCARQHGEGYMCPQPSIVRSGHAAQCGWPVSWLAMTEGMAGSLAAWQPAEMQAHTHRRPIIDPGTLTSLTMPVSNTICI